VVLRSLICAIAAVGIVVTGPTVAFAVPSPSSVEAQIDKQWNDLEPVIEQYNDTHNKLLKNQAQQKKLNAQLTPLQVQVDVALSQVRGLATDAYMQGAPNAFNAMLVSGTPTGLTDKLMYLDQLAKHQQQQIAGVAALRDKLAGTKVELDSLTKSIAARDSDLAKKKVAISSKINSLQKLRIQAYGSANVDDGPLHIGPCPYTYTNDKGGRAAQKACDLVGSPYVFGAEGPSTYDCSGLTKVAWASVGVGLDHFTGDQINEGRAVTRGELKPGDLLFYGRPVHHVSIYIGGGMMVHAPHTGDHVRMAKMDSPGEIVAYRRPG
jgi:cell wall-associated NlpC family hydrolase